MNNGRKTVINKAENSMNLYPFCEYRDLISFSICAEYVCNPDDEPDFDELVVVVDKDWLFELMQTETKITNPRKYL